MNLGEPHIDFPGSVRSLEKSGTSNHSLSAPKRENPFDIRRSTFGVRCSAFTVLRSLPFVLLLLGNLAAKAQLPREYQLKAVFLYNFAQFTEWPANAFTDTNSSIVIGIVGVDFFGGVLEQTIRGETVSGHPLTVQHFSRADDIKTCHLLFVPQSENRHVDEILNAVKNKPVLTVSDVDNPATSGAMIRFVIENNKVHFRVNAEAAHAANITLSSKLLRVAEVSPPGRSPP